MNWTGLKNRVCKKNIYELTAIGAAALYILISAAAVLHPSRAMSENENRELAGFPEFSFERLVNGEFMTDFEAYAADQFRWRDAAVSLKADAEYLTGRKENNGVFFGDDGYLIARPPEYSSETIDKNMEAIAQLAEVEKPEITVAVVPTAFEVLRDKLPAKAYDDRIERALARVEEKAAETDVTLCNTMKVLELHRGEDIFYRTDHHQTALGSYYTYCALAGCLGYDAHGLDEYDTEVLSDNFYGTSWSKAALTFARPDTVMKYSLRGGAQKRVEIPGADVNFDGLYAMDRLSGKDKYSVYLDGNHPLTVIHADNGTGRNLAVFKDSYAHSAAQFLSDHFDTIHLIDMRYYNDDVIRYIGENGITDILVLYSADEFMADDNLTKAGDLALTSDYLRPPYGVLGETEPVGDDYFADAVILGDSLVDGFSYSANIPARFVCKTSVNTRTVYTETLEDSGQTLIDTMLGTNASKFYIMLGINEVSYTPPERYKEDYRKIIRDIRVQNAESVVYIMSVLPVAHSVEDEGQISKEKIDAYNEVLKELAMEESCYYLDIGSVFAEPDGYLSEDAAADGIHVGADHHRRWEEYLKTHAVNAASSVTAAAAVKLYTGGGSADLEGFANEMLSAVEFRDKLSKVNDTVASRIFELAEGDALAGIVCTGGGGTAEEFAAFETDSPEKAEEIAEKLRKRIEKRKRDFEGYIPEEMPKLENALVEVRGNCAVMCVSDDNDAARSVIDKYF